MTDEINSSLSKLFDQLSSALEEDDPNTASKTLESFLSASVDGRGDPATAGAAGEDQEGWPSEGMDHLLDGLMQQLLSKDVLYEPMKELASKYPSYLLDRADVLTPDQVSCYRSQLDCIQRLVLTYERSGGGSFSEVLAVLQEIQSYGPPPPELLDGLSSGLPWDGLEGGPTGASQGKGAVGSCSVM